MLALLLRIGDLFRARFTTANDLCIANLIARGDCKFVALDAFFVELGGNFSFEFFAWLRGMRLPNADKQGDKQTGVFHGKPFVIVDDDGIVAMTR